MKPVVYYDRKTRAWWGFWVDDHEYQMHDAVFGNDRDGVLIELGAIKEDVVSVNRKGSKNETPDT